MVKEQEHSGGNDTDITSLSLDDIRVEMSRIEKEISYRRDKSNAAVERCLNRQGWTGKTKLGLSKIGFSIFRDKHPWSCDYDIGDTNEGRKLLELRRRMNELMGIGIEKLKSDELPFAA